MASATEVLTLIGAALAHDARRLKYLSEEMAKHADSHSRYLGLQRDSETHEESARGLTALLGAKGFQRLLCEDKTDAIERQLNGAPSPTELRNGAVLWQHLAQYLRFASQAQMEQILDFLAQLEIDATRQAVESAVKTHPRVFAIMKRGRQRFITLTDQRFKQDDA
jgi:DNA-binding transcriptional regulator YdaS (Cro superfamily)